MLRWFQFPSNMKWQLFQTKTSSLCSFLMMKYNIRQIPPQNQCPSKLDYVTGLSNWRKYSACKTKWSGQTKVIVSEKTKNDFVVSESNGVIQLENFHPIQKHVLYFKKLYYQKPSTLLICKATSPNKMMNLRDTFRN